MKHFLSKLDHDRIVAAIAAAESKTSAELRVHVTGRVPKDLEARALRRFHLLGMTRTAQHNGVLIYIAPRAREFRILGDTAIHERGGEALWNDVVQAMESHFRSERFTDGVVAGIQLLGEALARHFPHSDTDRDELPDTIDEE